MKNSENIHPMNVFAGAKVWQARKFKTIQKHGVWLLPTRWRLCQPLGQRERKSRIKKNAFDLWIVESETFEKVNGSKIFYVYTTHTTLYQHEGVTLKMYQWKTMLTQSHQQKHKILLYDLMKFERRQKKNWTI